MNIRFFDGRSPPHESSDLKSLALLVSMLTSFAILRTTQRSPTRRNGRPTVPVEQRLGPNLVVRLSARDHAAVRLLAKRAGLPLAIYVRHTLFDCKLPTVAPAANLDILRELNRIGNNLNQLTRLAHTGRISRKLLSIVEDLAERIHGYHRALLGLDGRPPD